MLVHAPPQVASTIGETIREARWSSYHDLISPTTLLALTELGLEMPERKREYTLGVDGLLIIDTAVREISSVLHLAVNTAILKCYRQGDGGSKAYIPHVDPERFSRRRLTFCNIYGSAILRITNGPSIDYKPNTVVVMHPLVEHEATEPTNESGARVFLFLGYDHTKQTR